MKGFRRVSGLVPLAALAAAAWLPSQAMAQPVDTTICRGPGFYQTHSGSEKDTANVAQEIITAVDGIDVCGHHIVTTDDLGGLDSALEGLCVRTQDVDLRQLYRQLITANLNCQVSEGTDCDDITGRFIAVSYSDCDALCAGDPVDEGPTVEQCIYELKCFNGGGRMIEGECFKGTCDDDGVTYCGNDDDCADEIECVRFEDSCSKSQFCSEDLDANAQVCPKKGAASSPKTCRDARRNGCTIDDYSCYASCSNYDPCVAACEATEGCDPVVVCDDGLSCYEQCLFDGFGDRTPCGCEYAYAIFCDAFAVTTEEFYECLLDYPVAEGNGFCTYCEESPLSCLL